VDLLLLSVHYCSVIQLLLPGVTMVNSVPVIVCVNLLGVVFFGEKNLLVSGRLTPYFIKAYCFYK